MPDTPTEITQPPRTKGANNPTVSWFELFFDLVVVAAVNITNDRYLEHPSTATALLAIVGLIGLCWVWLLTTVFNNVYPGDGVVRRLAIVVQMAALMVAALAVDDAENLGYSTGMVAFGVAILVPAVLILNSTRGTVSRPLGRQAPPLVLAATICIVAGLVAPAPLGPYLLVALLIGIVPMLAVNRGRLQTVLGRRTDHLRERLGLFVLIVLGDGFLFMVQALAQADSIPNPGAFAMTFIISFAIWWLYFEGTFSARHSTQPLRWRLSLSAHLLLVLGMIGTLDSLVLFTIRDQARLGDQNLGYFAVSVALVLVAFSLLGVTVRGRWGVVSWVQATSGLAIGVLGLTAVPAADLTVFAVMTGIGIIVIANAAFAGWSDRRQAISVTPSG